MLKSKFVEINISYIWNVGLAFYAIASIFIWWSSWVVVNGFFCKSFVSCVSFFYSYYLTHFFFQVNWMISVVSWTSLVIVLMWIVHPAEHTQKVSLFSYFRNICSSFFSHCGSWFCTKLTKKTWSFTHRKQVFLKFYTIHKTTTYSYQYVSTLEVWFNFFVKPSSEN